jgi:RNA polymerase sigma factor (sigma-70 family)
LFISKSCIRRNEKSCRANLDLSPRGAQLTKPPESLSDQPSPPGLDDLFRNFYHLLHRKAYAIVHVRPEAEDMVGDAFVRLQDHVAVTGWEIFGADIHEGALRNPRSRTTRNVLGWLFKTTIRLACNARSERLRRKRRLREVSRREWAPPPPDPIASIMHEEEHRLVERILDRLPPRHARILFMIEMGLSCREMARELGVAPNSIGPLLARARAAFLAQLRQDPEGIEEQAARGCPSLGRSA